LTADPWTTRELDDLLALQLAVAWAGESLSEPPRLGWWRTDIVDAEGGGYLMSRLLPLTHRWAALLTARRAAAAVDRRARLATADPDRVRTLFFWGFTLDEQLGLRLDALREDGGDPADRLPLPFPLTHFDAEAVSDALQRLAPEARYRVTPAGRLLEGAMPEAPVAAARMLASALTPAPEAWPMPFFRLER